MKLQEDLYAYLWQDPYENNCNTYVIDGEITVLIDPGHSRHLSRIFHQMKEDGISSEQIALVIITHSHPDHFEGLEAFIDTPVKIAMGRKEERYLRKDALRYYLEFSSRTVRHGKRPIKSNQWEKPNFF